MLKEDPEKAKKLDEIIRSTYRTLMTRGQKGCFVYCTGPKLAEYLKERYLKITSNNGVNRLTIGWGLQRIKRRLAKIKTLQKWGSF